MKKLKVSWTILNAWASGRQDDAIKMIAGIDQPKTPAMIEGSRIHDIIAQKKLRLIPEISDEAIFEDIRPADHSWVNYFKVSLTEWLDLSMVLDVLDLKNHLIVDWKASTKRSTEHPKMQIYLYALGARYMKFHDIREGIFATVRDYDGAIVCDDYSVFSITPAKLELAKNYAETIGSEIYSFLQGKKEEGVQI